MDPVTAAVVAAIALGATKGMTETATQVVKDAYAGLKGLIARKYTDVDVSALERKPDSDTKKESLAEDLEDAGAAGDTELGAAAAALLEAVRQQAPEAVIGIDIEKLRAGALNIADVSATSGTGARLYDSEITGTVDIRGIRAGAQEPPHPRPARD